MAGGPSNPAPGTRVRPGSALAPHDNQPQAPLLGSRRAAGRDSAKPLLREGSKFCPHLPPDLPSAQGGGPALGCEDWGGRAAGLSDLFKLGGVRGQRKRGRDGFKEKEREEKGAGFQEETVLRRHLSLERVRMDSGRPGSPSLKEGPRGCRGGQADRLPHPQFPRASCEAPPPTPGSRWFCDNVPAPPTVPTSRPLSVTVLWSGHTCGGTPAPHTVPPTPGAGAAPPRSRRSGKVPARSPANLAAALSGGSASGGNS